MLRSQVWVEIFKKISVQEWFRTYVLSRLKRLDANCWGLKMPFSPPSTAWWYTSKFSLCSFTAFLPRKYDNKSSLLIYVWVFLIFQGSRSVIGINFQLGNELKISDGAFERMSNVQFLRFQSDFLHPSPYVLESLNWLPREVRLLHWIKFPMTCLPSNFNPEFLVEINMRYSNLEKLWEGNKVSTNIYISKTL